MKDKAIPEELLRLSAVIKAYVNTRVDLFKLTLLEHTTKSAAQLFMFITLMVVCSFIMLFAAFAFSFWYGEKTGNIWVGFLISAGFYILILAVLLIFRRKLFVNTILRNFAKVFFEQEQQIKKEK